MELSFAPMEGISGYIYRNTHARIFGGVEEYYAPFVAPDGSGNFKTGHLKDLLPDNNRNIRLIPQLLVNRAEPFLLVAKQLQDLGYDEVNLNIGCPSGTVVAKHKGAGMLADLNSLEICLEEIFEACPIKVSIKTRMGMESTGEFGKILEIYNKFPLSRLIIHARTRSGMYKSRVDHEAFKLALSDSKCPVCYNGNVFSPDAVRELEALPGIEGIMLGRGLVCDPGLARQIKGSPSMTLSEFKRFHDDLLEGFLEADLGDRIAIARLKELWFYMLYKFPGSKKESKAMLKSQKLADYRSAVSALFSSGLYNSSASFWQEEN